MKAFQSFVVSDEPEFSTKFTTQTTAELPEGEVTIQVAYSSVNYKDALASIPNGGVIRGYPMVPGIDASGIVLESSDSRFHKGDKVIVTSFGFGVSHPGGYSEVQRVPADWVLHSPENLSLKEAMILGTAGFTAALAVQAIEDAGANKDNRILITGASGGVGSISLAMLTNLGYNNLTAVSRKPAAQDWLKNLGATTVVSPEELIPDKIKPLAKQQFDFAIDTVGGKLLEAVIPTLQYGGSIALCGNAGGSSLNTTVMPFILRGINVLGIDSVNTPMEKRIKIWQRLATELKVCKKLRVNEVAFKEIPPVFESLLQGTHEGRTIVRINGGLQ